VEYAAGEEEAAVAARRRAFITSGHHHAYKSPGVALACCTDALKPVVFKIEAMRDDTPPV